MKYILTERQLNFLREQKQDVVQQAYELMVSGSHGPGTDPDKIVRGIDMLKTKDEFYTLNDMFKDKRTDYDSFDKMIKGEFTFSAPFDNLDDMKKVTTKLEQLGVPFGYGSKNRYRDFTITPKPAPVASGSVTPRHQKAENWKKVLNYLLTNGFPPDFPKESIYQTGKDDGPGNWVDLQNQKYQISFYDNGSFTSRYQKGGSFRESKWSWDGSKPVIEGGYEFQPTKKPSGYATTIEDITTGNKILGLGSRGDLVKQVQYRLVDWWEVLPEIGCKADPKSEQDCDGIYGEKTKKAVRDFQKKSGAKSTEGNVGKETLTLLGIP